MKKIKILYIDDTKTELLRYKQLFEKSGNFNVSTTKIKDDSKINSIRDDAKKDVDLILIDLRLCWIISGSTLATDIRQNFPEYPIVLFTRKEIFETDLPQIIKKDLTEILDEVTYKDDLDKNPDKILQYLYDLAMGYKSLRDIKEKEKNKSNLIKLLASPQQDEDDLIETKPPLDEKGSWVTFKAAKWINDVLLMYPGILYDSIYSATELGISEKEFLGDKMKDFFKDALYNGIFNSDARWWKSRLYSLARKIMNEDERSFRLNQGFPMAWERIKETKLEKSKCIFSGESPADGVCCILKKPMMLTYSLKYNMDSRPPIMKEARISHKAIKTKDINENFIDPLDRDELEKIRIRGRSK